MSRSMSSTASRRHATPLAKISVRARTRSLPSPSKKTSRVVGSMRVVEARDQDLRPEAPRLHQRAARQLVPRDAAGKSEIVFDPRGGPGLTSRRLALDDERAQS